MINLEEFLGEVPQEPPCGADLTYDADFLALENAARGKNEQQFGDTVIPAEQPDWREVEKRAAALLMRSKDLRIAVALCRAWVNVKGLPGLAGGVSLVADLLDRYWDNIHPMAEDGDYFMRMNAVSSLNEVTGLIRDVRQVDFLRSSSAGSVSVRDAEALARGNTVEAGNKMSVDQLRGAVAEAWRKENEGLLAVVATGDAAARIVKLCAEKLPAHQRPEMDSLQALLGALRGLLPQEQEVGSAALESTTEPGAQGPAGQTAQGQQQGVLRSREDAIAQLLVVAAFVEKTEPTNPAPLLIRRAARLMRMGFIDILRELSPESLAQVENITGGASPP
jgi:type VI secretion system protein ImpA